MNIKRIGIVLFALMMVFSSISFAARGGARMPSMKAPAATAPKAPAAAPKNPGGTEKAYTPSKNAASLNNKAPAQSGTAAKTGGTAWGNTLRNIGLFAGGMFLGSMLANLFGMGGFMGDILGLLCTGLALGLIVMLLLSLWRKMTNRKTDRKNDNLYARREVFEIKDIEKPKDSTYESRSKADEYRKK